MGFFRRLLHRENKWLIGVYKERLVTVSNWERNNIWRDVKEIRSAGVFVTHPARKRLEPYFFPLDFADYPINIEYGDRGFLDGYGLKPLAYRYGPAPIPAYGHEKKGAFVLSARVAREYEKTHNVSLRTLLTGRPCVLALKAGEFPVRTGTFFMPFFESEKIVFEPCRNGNGKYVVGKGILTHISGEWGCMNAAESYLERLCPVSRLGTSFKDTEYNKFCYAVYREVSTDLRADMPLAMLKISRMKNSFEDMFRKLGESVKEQLSEHPGPFKERYLTVHARNVLLDGTIVDYADLLPAEKNLKRDEKLVHANNEIRSMLLSAVLVSVAHKEALMKMGQGKKGLSKILSEHAAEIVEGYRRFFDCFEDGLGEEKIGDKRITEYFSWMQDIKNYIVQRASRQ